MSTAMTGEGSGSAITKVKPKVQISEYNKGKVVGQGAFGKVMLATEIATGKEVAIKEVDQDTISKLGKTRHIFREKNLLNEMDHPFIIKLLGTTMDDANLYFIFESCRNGDLANLLEKRCKYLSFDHQRFVEKLDLRIVKAYGAQLVCTLEYLQTLEIMHRDLKPQNLLLDDEMNLKMIDFGDAKKENEPPLEDEEPPQEETKEASGDG